MQGEVGDEALVLAILSNVDAYEAMLMPAAERQNAQDVRMMSKMYRSTRSKAERWASAIIRTCSFIKPCSLKSGYKRSNTYLEADYTLLAVGSKDSTYERNTKSLDEQRNALEEWYNIDDEKSAVAVW